MKLFQSLYAFVSSHKAELATVAAFFAANVPAIAGLLPPPLRTALGALAVLCGLISGHKYGSASR